MKDKPRIGTVEWIRARPDAIAIFNGAYDECGNPAGDVHADGPWTTFTPGGEWEHHATHAEALEWALQEAGKR